MSRLAHLTDRAIATGAAWRRVTRERGLTGWQRLDDLPFEPARGYPRDPRPLRAGRCLLSVKGAPEIVLAPVHPPPAHSHWTSRRATAQAGRPSCRPQGYRILAVAERAVRPRQALDDEDVSELALLGFLALADPVRTAASASLAGLREAGVHIVMITGDHPATAKAIAEPAQRPHGGQVMTGPDLDDLDDAAWTGYCRTRHVVARGTPAHKVRVVRAFRGSAAPWR